MRTTRRTPRKSGCVVCCGEGTIDANGEIIQAVLHGVAAQPGLDYLEVTPDSFRAWYSSSFARLFCLETEHKSPTESPPDFLLTVIELGEGDSPPVAAQRGGSQKILEPVFMIAVSVEQAGLIASTGHPLLQA